MLLKDRHADDALNKKQDDHEGNDAYHDYDADVYHYDDFQRCKTLALAFTLTVILTLTLTLSLTLTLTLTHVNIFST